LTCWAQKANGRTDASFTIRNPYSFLLWRCMVDPRVTKCIIKPRSKKWACNVQISESLYDPLFLHLIAGKTRIVLQTCLPANITLQLNLNIVSCHRPSADKRWLWFGPQRSWLQNSHSDFDRIKVKLDYSQYIPTSVRDLARTGPCHCKKIMNHEVFQTRCSMLFQMLASQHRRETGIK